MSFYWRLIFKVYCVLLLFHTSWLLTLIQQFLSSGYFCRFKLYIKIFQEKDLLRSLPFASYQNQKLIQEGQSSTPIEG